MIARSKVLVTGATGRQGGAVARALLERGHAVRALTRDAAKPEAEELRKIGAEVVRGDYEDPSTIRAALRGVDAVFLMATPYEKGPEAERQGATNVVDAATDARVKHLVYSSVAGADQRTGILNFESKRRVEERLERSGLRYSIVAPVFFMENFVSPWMLPGLAQGKVSLALSPETKLQVIGVETVARFVAEVVEKPDEFHGMRIDIGSDDLTVREMTAILSRAAGKRLVYEETPKDVFREAAGDDLTKMHEWFENVGFSADVAGLRRDYPHVGWRTFEEWARGRDWSLLEPTPVHAAR